MTAGGHDLTPCRKCHIYHCSKCGCPRDSIPAKRSGGKTA